MKGQAQLEHMVNQYHFDAMSLLSQYSLELVANDNGCLASSVLLEKDYMVCCEGDTSTVVMMMIMKALTGHVPYYGEYTSYDLEENAFLFNHHGDGDQRPLQPDAVRRLSAMIPRTMAAGHGDRRLQPVVEEVDVGAEGQNLRNADPAADDRQHRQDHQRHSHPLG